MVVAVTSADVLAMLREAFGFIQKDHGFLVDHESADGIGALIGFASERTYVAVAWDLRSNDLSAEFYPIDTVTHRPRLTTRVLLSELLAVSGASISECVRAPETVTRETARGAAGELARSVQKYASTLLAGDWDDVEQRVEDWTHSGAWRMWREG